MRASQDSELCIWTTRETTRVRSLTRAIPNCPNQHRGTLLSIRALDLLHSTRSTEIELAFVADTKERLCVTSNFTNVSVRYSISLQKPDMLRRSINAHGGIVNVIKVVVLHR